MKAIGIQYQILIRLLVKAQPPFKVLITPERHADYLLSITVLSTSNLSEDLHQRLSSTSAAPLSLRFRRFPLAPLLDTSLLRLLL